MISKPLLKYIRDNDLLTKQQSVFRKQHITETALQLIIEDRLRPIGDRGQEVIALFLDYQRAFEMPFGNHNTFQ